MIAALGRSGLIPEHAANLSRRSRIVPTGVVVQALTLAMYQGWIKPQQAEAL